MTMEALRPFHSTPWIELRIEELVATLLGFGERCLTTLYTVVLAAGRNQREHELLQRDPDTLRRDGVTAKGTLEVTNVAV